MEEGKLTCNYRGCRRALESIAWVTNCYHIFCSDHGSLLMKASSECQACGTLLSEENNMVKVSLNPREYVRNMTLMGLQPEVVLEMSRRAISFWSYQMEQEQRFQAHVSNRYKEGLKVAQTYYEQQLKTLEGHNLSLKRQLERVQQELQRIRGEKEVLNEKLIETLSCQRPKFAHDPMRKNTGITVMDEIITYKIPHTAVTSSLMPLPPMEGNQPKIIYTSPRLSHLDLAVSHPSPALRSTYVHRQPIGRRVELEKGTDNYFEAREVHPPNSNIQPMQYSHHQQVPIVKHTQENDYDSNKNQQPHDTAPSPWVFNPAVNSRRFSTSTQALSSVKYEEFIFAPVLQENRSEQVINTQSTSKSF
ncbi:uncharacterized protein [Palaemon carinicauda]|uniref:uncharacterized protein n=1 Tax=Palaemon carinicauda TaxID=392227 RepID=UPI0035B582D7